MGGLLEARIGIIWRKSSEDTSTCGAGPLSLMHNPGHRKYRCMLGTGGYARFESNQ